MPFCRSISQPGSSLSAAARHDETPTRAYYRHYIRCWHHGNPGQANYAASKAGMIGMFKSLAQEVASRGISQLCGPRFYYANDGCSFEASAKALQRPFLQADWVQAMTSPPHASIWQVMRLHTSPARHCMSMAAWRWFKAYKFSFCQVLDIVLKDDS